MSSSVEAATSRALLREHGIGDTPLFSLEPRAGGGRVLLKAEYRNPYGGAKDRTAAYLLTWAAEVAGAGADVIESTSGNLGIALARLGPSVGLQPTLVMDVSLPGSRYREAARAGARVLLVEAPRPGMTMRETRIEIAREFERRLGYLSLDQYGNRAAVRAHRETTGPEILAATEGRVGAVVAAVGTGATICGIGAAFRTADRDAMIVGVEPEGSTIAGGVEGRYLPAGAGMRGRPEIVERFGDAIDYFVHVPDAVAAAWALHLRRSGFAVGHTSGATTAVAAALAERDGFDVVAVAHDDGEAFLPQMRRLAAGGEADHLAWRPPATELAAGSWKP